MMDGPVASVLLSLAITVASGAVGALALRYVARRACMLEWTYRQALPTALVPLLVMEALYYALVLAFDIDLDRIDGLEDLAWQLPFIGGWLAVQFVTIKVRHRTSALVAAKIAGLAALMLVVAEFVLGAVATSLSVLFDDPR